MSSNFFDAFVFPSQASYFAKQEDLQSFLIKNLFISYLITVIPASSCKEQYEEQKWVWVLNR